MIVFRAPRWVPAERPVPVSMRPQPTRVTVLVDTELLGAVVAGASELRLPDDVVVAVGDIVHLVERADGTNNPRCCYRLVTRKRRGEGCLVTVQAGTGHCEGRHG